MPPKNFCPRYSILSINSFLSFCYVCLKFGVNLVRETLLEILFLNFCKALLLLLLHTHTQLAALLPVHEQRIRSHYFLGSPRIIQTEFNRLMTWTNAAPVRTRQQEVGLLKRREFLYKLSKHRPNLSKEYAVQLQFCVMQQLFMSVHN